MGRVLVTRRLPDGGLGSARGRVTRSSDRNADDTPYTPDELARSPAECDAIVSLLTDRIDADVLDAGARGGRLRVVANVAVGYDNIDVRAAAAHGITVCNTPGVLDDTTADTAFLLILAACAARVDRRSRPARRPLEGLGHHAVPRPRRARRDARHRRLRPHRPRRRPARRRASACTCCTTRARLPTSPATSPTSTSCSPRADIVSLHMPGGADTHHLIDARRLALMKPTAVLVNTARGTVVDEVALADALHEGRLFAAGLDVYEREPAVEPRLLSAPRTVLLPAHRLRRRRRRAPAWRPWPRRGRDGARGGTPPNIV